MAGNGVGGVSSGPLVTAVLPTQVCGEQHRFEKLMEYFQKEDSNIDFMVSSRGSGHPRCKEQPGGRGLQLLGSAPAK